MPQITRALQMEDRVQSVHSLYRVCTGNKRLATTMNDHGVTVRMLNR
jgi:hypothetical protein